ncbi:MAG: hypothetical protein JW709_01560, partial [Sedimentisphaerales bacterium]|nr:hypothetical protein [Sedimentisphaerales bacterium]
PSHVNITYCDIDGGQNDIDLDDSVLNWNIGNFSSDPMYTVGDWHLSADSPCIDAGTNEPEGGLPPTDLDGNPRPIDGNGDLQAIADIGADEYLNRWYVDADVAQSGNGRSWQQAFKTLREALVNPNLQAYDDHIWVAGGTYKPTDGMEDPYDRMQSFIFDKPVRVFGGFAGTETYLHERNWNVDETILSGDLDDDGLDADNSMHVVIGSDGVILDGFILEMGYADGIGEDANGGGLIMTEGEYQSAFHLRQCIIRLNYAAGNGGGLYIVMDDHVCLENCLIQANTAGLNGGGWYCSDDDRVYSVNCTLAFNRAGGQGGGAFGEGHIDISNTIVWGNEGGDANPKWNQIDSFCGHTYYLDIIGSLVQYFEPSDYDEYDVNNVLDPGGDFTPFIKNAYDGGDGWGQGGNDNLGDLRLKNLAVDPDDNPCIDAGDDEEVELDWDDLDGDGNTSEPFPWDLGRRYRCVDDVMTPDGVNAGNPPIDIGAYEGGVNIWYVNAAQTESGDGTSWAQAFKTLQEALTNPRFVRSDQIWVAGGTYKPTDGLGDPLDQTASFVINKGGMYIYGGFAGTETFLHERNWVENETILSGDLDGDGLDADNSMHVVVVDANAKFTLLDGFIVEMGYADGVDGDANGGGILNHAYWSHFRHCIVRLNYAFNHGGGLFNAAIYCYATQSVFVGNTAQANGGGIAHGDSLVGGGYYDCTIAFNHAGGLGGGLYAAGDYEYYRYDVWNTIIWGNSGSGNGQDNQIYGHVTEQYRSVGFSLIQYYVTAQDYCPDGGGPWPYVPGNGSSPFRIDPDDGGDGWGNTNDNLGDLRLSSGSSCIDFGLSITQGTIHDAEDLDGDGVTIERHPWDLARKPRFVDDPSIEDGFLTDYPAIDVGAYEYQPDEEPENTPPVADLSATTETSFLDCDGDGQVVNVALNGAASHDDDPGDAITEYIWYEQIDEAWELIPSTGEATLNLEFLAVGSHIFGLDVVDSHDAHAASLAQIAIEVAANAAPVAEAGDPINVDDDDPIGVEPVALNGSASTDDCAITAYYWYKGIDKIAEGAEPTVNLGVGEHVITLIVVDSGGLQGTDTVNVTVNPEPLPAMLLIDAGADRTILSPANKVNLTSSLVNGDEGMFDSVEWTLISAPPGGGGCAIGTYDNELPSGVGAYPETIITAQGGQMSITFPEEIYGSYVIRAAALDEFLEPVEGADDYVQITIEPSASGHQGPEVVATITQFGSNSYEFTLTGENYAVNLSGLVTDDGGPFGRLSARWWRISGPVGGVYFDQAEFSADKPGLSLAADTAATFYKPGTYLLQLTGDDGDLSAAKVVEVIVSEDTQNPLIVTASLQPITPGEPLQHEGTVPFSSNVTAVYGQVTGGTGTVTYEWSQVSGPADVDFDGTQGLLDATVTFSTPGLYVIKLKSVCGTQTLSDELTINVTGSNLLIDAGHLHSLVRLQDKTVGVCGTNHFAQLGIGSFEAQGYLTPVLKGNQPNPPEILYLSNNIAATGGWTHSMSLDNNGHVWAWGANYSGQLGNGTNVGSVDDYYETAPVQVVAPDFNGDEEPDNLDGNVNTEDYLGDDIPVINISAGGINSHSLAVDAQGRVFSWGRNEFGDLGIDEINTYRNLPVPVHAGEQGGIYLSNIIMVSAGDHHSMALEQLDDNPATDPNGRVLTWGADKFIGDRIWPSGDIAWPRPIERGLLGQGLRGNYPGAPDEALVPGFVWAGDQAGENGVNDGRTHLADIVAISAGWLHNLALEKIDPDNNYKGRVYAWGYNGEGVVDGSNSVYDYAKKCDGGRLGIDSIEIVKNEPVVVTAGEQFNYTGENSLIDIVAISAGESHSMALDKYGHVYVWGANKFGQLGNGTNISSKTPVHVLAPDLDWDGKPDDLNGNGIEDDYLSDIVAIAAGYWHCLAMDKNGNVYSWGLCQQLTYQYLDYDKGMLGTGFVGSIYEPDYYCYSYPYSYENTPHIVTVNGQVCNVSRKPVSWYMTITEGINDAGSGDILVIYPGIYNENLIIEQSITLRSAMPANAASQTILDAYGTGQPAITIHGTGAGTVVLEGLTIKNGSHGINCYFNNTLDLDMRHCILTDILYGVSASDEMKVNIDQCKFIGNTLQSIVNYDCEVSYVITNSIFEFEEGTVINGYAYFLTMHNNVILSKGTSQPIYCSVYNKAAINHNTFICPNAWQGIYISAAAGCEIPHVSHNIIMAEDPIGDDWQDYKVDFNCIIDTNTSNGDDGFDYLSSNGNISEWPKIRNIWKYNCITTTQISDGEELYGVPWDGYVGEFSVNNPSENFSVGDIVVLMDDGLPRIVTIVDNSNERVAFYPPEEIYALPNWLIPELVICNWGNQIQPYFYSPNFIDVVACTTISNERFTVENGSVYTLGDLIEYNKDGIVRMVIDIQGDTVIFFPAIDCITQTTEGDAVTNWGQEAWLVTEDLHLAVDSPCIDAGGYSEVVAGATDDEIPVAEASIFTVGDMIEIDRDGTPRKITGIDGDTLKIVPQFQMENIPAAGAEVIYRAGLTFRSFDDPIQGIDAGNNRITVDDSEGFFVKDFIRIDYADPEIEDANCVITEVDYSENRLTLYPVLVSTSTPPSPHTLLHWSLHNLTDIDGEDRLMGITPDIGADEFQPWAVEAGQPIEETLSWDELEQPEAIIHLAEAEVLYRGSGWSTDNITVAWTIIGEPSSGAAEFIEPSNKVKTSIRCTEVGAYQLKLTVTDEYGHLLGSDIVTIYIHMGLEVTAEPTPAMFNGEETTSTLTATPIGNTAAVDHWQWVGPSYLVLLDTPTAQSTNATFTQPGEYEFRVYAKNATGEILAQDNIWVNVVYPDVEVEAGENQTVYLAMEADGVRRARANLSGHLIGADAENVNVEWEISEEAQLYATVDEATKNSLVSSITFLERPGYEVDYHVGLKVFQGNEFLCSDEVVISVKYPQFEVVASASSTEITLPNRTVNLHADVLGGQPDEFEWVYYAPGAPAGLVTFGNANDPDTWVTFNEVGGYNGAGQFQIGAVAKMTIDGELKPVTSDSVIIMVNNDGSGSPFVDTFTLTLMPEDLGFPSEGFPWTVGIWAVMENDGLPFDDYDSAVWSWQGEGDAVTIDNGEISDPCATVTIHMPGCYVLSLVVSDDVNGILKTATRTIAFSNVGVEITDYDSEKSLLEAISLTGHITDPDNVVAKLVWSSSSNSVKFSPPVHLTPPFNDENVYSSATFQNSGQFPITLSALDSAGNLLYLHTVAVNITRPAHVVDAGDYEDVQLSGGQATVTLDDNNILGEVTGILTHQWTDIHNTGHVTFDPSAEVENPSAIFNVSGVYTLKYEAFEDEVSLGSDTAIIVVLPPDGASLVHAGSYRQVTLPRTVTLDDAVFVAGSAGVIPRWSSNSPDTVTFSLNDTTEQPTVSFSEPGRYILTLTAENDTFADPDPSSAMTIDVLKGDNQDTAGPVFGEVSYIDNSDGTITISVIAADDHSGVGYIALKLGDEILHTISGEPYYADELAFTHTVAKASLANGENVFTFVAVDACGNETSLPYAYNNDSDVYNFRVTYVNENTIDFDGNLTTAPTTSWELAFYDINEAAYPLGDPCTFTGNDTEIDETLNVSTWDNGTYAAKLSADSVEKASLEFVVKHGAANDPLAYLAWFDPTPEGENISLDIAEDHWQEHPEKSPLPVINESIADIFGVAADNLYPDEVEFKIDIFAKEVEQYVGFDTYGWYDKFFIRNVTPLPRTAGWRHEHVGVEDSPASLGQVDLSGLDNGVYYMLLTVRCGERISHDHALFMLDCPLKLGNVQFSQEDVVVSVGNVPIRIVRTYDSFKKHKDGEFGHGWTYSIANMNVELDEQRADLYPDDLWGNHTGRNVRVGSNYDRNVTLTLPDGRRTTFLFKLTYMSGSLYDGELPYYLAEYESLPDVNASLETLQEERLIWNPASGMGVAWNYIDGMHGVQQDPAMYDFSGYVLTTDDGVKYSFEREELTEEPYGDYFNFNKYDCNPYLAKVYGPLHLNRIAMPSGEEVRLNVDLSTGRIGKDGEKGIEIKHADDQTSKGLEIIYDDSAPGEAKRIRAINAPAEFGEDPDTGTPTVLYEYDNYGNLIKVKKLVDKNAAPDDRYETIEYIYDDVLYSPADHYITNIKDSRGIAPIRYEYDPAGRLVATIDGKGNRIEINHDVAGKVETIYERWDTDKQYPRIYVYNERGNVVEATSIGEGTSLTTSYLYGDSANPDSATEVSQDVPNYATPDPCDTVESVTKTVYDDHGRAVRVEDPAGNVTETAYDDKYSHVLRSAHFVPDPEDPINNTIKIITVNTYNIDSQMLTETLTAKVTNAQTEPGCCDDIYDAENFYQKTINEYDGRNRLTLSTQVDPDGVLADVVTSYSYTWNTGDPPYITDSYTPNDSQPYRVTDVSGRKQYVEYDANGNQVYSYTRWDDPQDEQDKWIVTKNFLDSQGRVTQTKQCIFDAIT